MTSADTDTALDLLDEWMAWWQAAGSYTAMPPRKLRDRTYVYTRTHQPGEIDERDVEDGARAMLEFENVAGINDCPRSWEELTPREKDDYLGYAEAVLKSGLSP